MTLSGYSPGSFAGSVSGTGAGTVDCDVRVELTLSGGRILLSLSGDLPASPDRRVVAELARPEAVRIRREIERTLQESRPIPSLPLGTFDGTYSAVAGEADEKRIGLELRGGGTHVAIAGEAERESGAVLTVEARLDPEAAVALNRHLDRLVRNL
jgi:hypothetical protein